MVVIGARSAYARLSGEPNDWKAVAEWKTKDDVTVSTDKFKDASNRKTVGKPRAAGKKVSTAKTGGAGRTRRSTNTMTPKMKEYKKAITPADSSNDEDNGEDDNDDEVEVVKGNDENADPGGRREARSGVIIPNMLPIPASLAVALMKAYAIDATTLCLKTIKAIKDKDIFVQAMLAFG